MQRTLCSFDKNIYHQSLNMKFTLKYFIVIFVLSYTMSCKFAVGSTTENFIRLKNKRLYINITNSGTINKFIISKTNGDTDTINFRTDRFAGPGYASVSLKQEHKGKPVYSSVVDGIFYQIEYQLKTDYLMVIATVHNQMSRTFSPGSVDFRLGVNHYQDEYPRWRNILFPTLLRIEKTHFWGYFMSPNGTILGIASPNPIPSWTIDYERMEKFPHYYTIHRIESSHLNLLHSESLRERFPKDKKSLLPNEMLVDTIYFAPVPELNKLKSTISALTKAPALSFDRYTLYPGEVTTATINSTLPVQKVTVKEEGSGTTKELPVKQLSSEVYQVQWEAPPTESRYVFHVSNVQDKQSEAVVYVRANWSDYLRKARTAGLKYLPTTTSNTEAFYTLYTYFLARKLVPDSIEDAVAEQVFKTIFESLFDPETKEMRQGKHRLQNAANMAAMLADRFEVTKDTNDLVNANGLIEFLMRNQKEDGGYYAPYPNREPVHYSCVNYVVKNMMDVATQMGKLESTSKIWEVRQNKTNKSVLLALTDLAYRKDNLDTEGQMSFDDGMISCSLGQLALGAIQTQDTSIQKEFNKVALEMYNLHRCLTQQQIPDARMNGATLRFWEAQYNVLFMHNILNSPCGWSARKIYGTYYLYLLTGEKKYLYETMNALGTSSQLIDLKGGTLNFAFVPDPYVKDKQFKPIIEGSRVPVLQDAVVGEQYLPAITDWETPPYYAWRPGVFGISNLVHEVFKAMEEISIQNAYIIENPDGSFETFNCKVRDEGNGLITVFPYENLVRYIHVNLINTYTVKVENTGKNNQNEYRNISGLRWLDEIPDLIKPVKNL
jgi:hypothetical protein